MERITMTEATTLPRNLDRDMYAKFVAFDEQYDTHRESDKFGVCTHCGHYEFECDPNFGICLVTGCACDDSDPKRDEKTTCEFQASWNGRESLWTTIDDSYAMDREKWFTRHAQSNIFVTLKLKRKHVALAIEFEKAITSSNGWFEIHDGRASGVQRNPSDCAVHVSFGSGNTSLAMHIGTQHYELAVRFEQALRDGAFVSHIHGASTSKAA